MPTGQPAQPLPRGVGSRLHTRRVSHRSSRPAHGLHTGYHARDEYPSQGPGEDYQAPFNQLRAQGIPLAQDFAVLHGVTCASDHCK